MNNHRTNHLTLPKHGGFPNDLGKLARTLCEENKYNLVMAISEFEIKRIEKIVGEFIEKILDKIDSDPHCCFWG